MVYSLNRTAASNPSPPDLYTDNNRQRESSTAWEIASTDDYLQDRMIISLAGAPQLNGLNPKALNLAVIKESPYSPAASPLPTVGHDGQFYDAQQYFQPIIQPADPTQLLQSLSMVRMLHLQLWQMR
ncbi:hypothetical protein SSX86_031202 [Deinandra increscens subsp. villosa]|uniref:Uncharacterized protein n=1 Tax=Deinandra increscens subsp. villosa TaxID=3103831 RepID=A0AAP0GIY3_9ASTR